MIDVTGLGFLLCQLIRSVGALTARAGHGIEGRVEATVRSVCACCLIPNAGPQPVIVQSSEAQGQQFVTILLPSGQNHPGLLITVTMGSSTTRNSVKTPDAGSVDPSTAKEAVRARRG